MSSSNALGEKAHTAHTSELLWYRKEDISALLLEAPADLNDAKTEASGQPDPTSEHGLSDQLDIHDVCSEFDMVRASK